MRINLQILFTLISLVFASACATGPGAKATKAAANVLLPPEQENELGRQMSAEFDKEANILEDSEVTSYVKQLGQRVVRAAPDKPEGIDFTFKVVDEPNTVNAFAMPGGYIYIYTGLLKMADNEAELVGVLGHEVAHVTRRHIAQRLVTLYGAQTLASVALGQNPTMLEELVAGVVANGYLLKYSRDHERDADEYGIQYTIRAGWNPIGYVSFFRKLHRQSEVQPPEMLSSHPAPLERSQKAREIIKRYQKRGTVPEEVGASRYKGVTAQIGTAATTSRR